MPDAPPRLRVPPTPPRRTAVRGRPGGVCGVLCLMLLAAPATAQEAAPPVPAAATAPDAAPEGAPRRVVSLYADVRAYGVGDLLTVVLAERTQARRASSSSAAASARVAGSGSASIGDFFGLDAGAAGQRDADSRTVQSDLLTGTITVRVVDVDAAGNLVVEGERTLSVDGDAHFLSVRGAVRPADVSTSNAVLSHQIANADVVYRQDGKPKFFRGRFLAVVGTVAVLVGAILLSGAADGVADVAAEVAAPDAP